MPEVERLEGGPRRRVAVRLPQPAHETKELIGPQRDRRGRVLRHGRRFLFHISETRDPEFRLVKMRRPHMHDLFHKPPFPVQQPFAPSSGDSLSPRTAFCGTGRDLRPIAISSTRRTCRPPYSGPGPFPRRGHEGPSRAANRGSTTQAEGSGCSSKKRRTFWSVKRAVMRMASGLVPATCGVMYSRRFFRE